MTTQEALTKRVREHMSQTGERYSAARRALLESSASPHADTRTAAPQHAEEQVRDKTGRGWNEWVAAIDAGPGRTAGHTEIATWLREQGVDSWWAQSITVGFERITGMRLPGQMPDGTFTVSRSRVIAQSPAEVRDLLMDADARAQLLPGFTIAELSRHGVKTARFGFARDQESIGQIAFAIDEAPAHRTALTVTHSRLSSHREGELWKEFWSEWLDALSG